MKPDAEKPTLLPEEPPLFPPKDPPTIFPPEVEPTPPLREEPKTPPEYPLIHPE